MIPLTDTELQQQAEIEKQQNVTFVLNNMAERNVTLRDIIVQEGLDEVHDYDSDSSSKTMKSCSSRKRIRIRKDEVNDDNLMDCQQKQQAAKNNKYSVDLKDPVRSKKKTSVESSIGQITQQRQPPIITEKLNSVKLTQDMKKIGANFKIVRGRHSDTIITTDKDSHTKIFDYIKNSNVNAHTYTRRSEKESTIILRGIHYSCDVKLIEEDILAQTGISCVVSPFETTWSKKNNSNYDLFKVRVKTAEEATIIKKLNEVYYHRVRWEKIATTTLIQCYNCQGFGHVARNCARLNRCVKCLSDHEPGKCELPHKDAPQTTAESAVSPLCVNCKGNHPASFRGCPEAIRLLNKMKKVQMDKKRERENKWEQMAFARQSAARCIVPEVSFRDALRSNTSDKQNYDTGKSKHVETLNKLEHSRLPGEDIMHFINSECENLFHLNFDKLISKVSSFVKDYQSLNSREAKQSAMLKFTLEICMN